MNKLWYICVRVCVCVCDGILFDLRKEGNSDTHYNMNETYRHYANEWARHKKQVLWFHLNEVNKIGKLADAESRTEVTRTERKGKGQFLFNGKGAEQTPVWKDGEVLEMESGGDGTMWNLTPLNCCS